MIVTCPNCTAKFLVADHLIPPAGRVVRCGSCKHLWNVTLAGGTAGGKADFASLVADVVGTNGAAASAAGNSFQLPAIAAKPLPAKPFLFAMPILAAAWLVVALYANYPSWMKAPVLSSIYGMLGATPTDGLHFNKANLAREQEGQRTNFIISGEIANTASETRTVPTVRVTLLDASGEEVASREYAVNVTIKPGDTYPFRITNMSTSFGDRVHEVVIDLGNDMQMMFR